MKKFNSKLTVKNITVRKEKKEPSNRKHLNLGIQMKLNGMILIIVVLFSGLLFFTGTKSMQYNDQYAQVLENISKITYIKTNGAKLARIVVNMCATGGAVDSGHLEMVETMQQYVVDIGENIGDEAEYSQNRNQQESLAKEVDKFVTLYEEIVAISGENYSSSASEQAARLDSSTPFLSTSAENLVTYEITRSEDLQQKIQKDFSSMISGMMVVIVLVVVITIIVAMLVSRSITRPILELMKKLSLIADGDLSGDDIQVKSADETGKLGTAFNKMKNNVADILRQVLDSTAELKIATETVNESMDENSKGSARIAESVGEMLERLEKQHVEVVKIAEQIQEME